MSDNLTESFSARRAVEALRTGIPNRSAVDFLGPGQPVVMDAFRQLLEKAGKSKDLSPGNSGFFIEGDFGSGKSHTLKWLQSYALRHGFACSKISIGKEAPPSNLTALFKIAIQELQYPDGRMPGSLGEAMERVDFKSSKVIDFDEALSRRGRFNPIFPISLRLYRRYLADQEILQEIIDFWDGGPFYKTRFNPMLQAIGEPALTLVGTTKKIIEGYRFGFAAGLLRAAGYNGWVVLMDELELIAKLPLNSRLKSYINLERLMFSDAWDFPSGLIFIGAITPDFRSVVFVERGDLASAQVASEAISFAATNAISFMNAREHRFLLTSPDRESLKRTRQQIEDIYSAAYAWEVSRAATPALGVAEASKSMRVHIREWITGWDMERLYENYVPKLIAETFEEDLSETSQSHEREVENDGT